MKISAITPKPRLFEDMIREDTTYKAFNRAGRMLVELKMSEKEILDLFANIEKGATAGGGNRTALGKGKDAVTDAATAISNAFSKVSSAISSSGFVSGFDVGVDKLTDRLATGAGGQSGAVMTAIKKYREFAKAHPIMQGAIYAGLVALTGLSGAGLGGAVILGGIKAFDKLLLGNKASSSLWSGFLTGATAYGIGQAQQAFSGGSAPDPTATTPDPTATTPVPQGNPNANLPAGSDAGLSDASNTNPSAVTSANAPDLDAETMAKNAANAKAYGIDGADSTADMNKAILKTADTTNVADYGQLGAAGNGTEYTIVKGDTLSDIAKANNVSVKELADANGIDYKDVNAIKAGQQLTIPNATGSNIYDQGVGAGGSGSTAATPGATSAPQGNPNANLPAGSDAGLSDASNTNPAAATPAGEIKPMGIQVGGSPVIPGRDLLPAQIKAVEANPGSFPQWVQDLYNQTINKGAPIPALGNAMAESRRDMNNMLMEAIVATTNSIKPFKAKTINLSAMIDRQATAHVWMLGESLGRNYKHRYHIIEAGIDNIFKNVERYQRHIQIVVAESLLNELDTPPAGVGKSSTATADATGPDRSDIPAQLRPDMPDAAAPAKKPGLLGRMWAGAKNIGHQFTTKTTADKLKMNWHVKGKPTESDEIATFLQGQGVPANVISDVFTQSNLPVPPAITAAAAVPAPSAAETPASPGNPDTPAVTKAKAAMGINPDAPTDTTATPTAPKLATRTGPTSAKVAKQAVDSTVATVSKVRTRDRTGVVNYAKQKIDAIPVKAVTAPAASESRLTARAKNALDMFENFVEKTKVETNPLTESNTRPLIKRALTEQKAKQSIKITKKAVVQRNEVIDLWKKMPG